MYLTIDLTQDSLVGTYLVHVFFGKSFKIVLKNQFEFFSKKGHETFGGNFFNCEDKRSPWPYTSRVSRFQTVFILLNLDNTYVNGITSPFMILPERRKHKQYSMEELRKIHTVKRLIMSADITEIFPFLVRR